MIELVELMEELGYYCFWVVEYYNMNGFVGLFLILLMMYLVF